MVIILVIVDMLFDFILDRSDQEWDCHNPCYRGHALRHFYNLNIEIEILGS